MCCSATGPGDELERTLDRLLQVTGKPEARRGTPTYIVIETSGLADPAPIIQTFFRCVRARVCVCARVRGACAPPWACARPTLLTALDDDVATDTRVCEEVVSADECAPALAGLILARALCWTVS
ncbi:hypothetical protein EON67_01310 [archaeon]|nr:MAG: hypothetical protein EON67_01310 [archaeon]